MEILIGINPDTYDDDAMALGSLLARGLHWQVTFMQALRTFRTAALRVAKSLKSKHLRQRYTSKPHTVTEATKKRFAGVLTLEDPANPQINPTLQAYVDRMTRKAAQPQP